MYHFYPFAFGLPSGWPFERPPTDDRDRSLRTRVMQRLSVDRGVARHPISVVTQNGVVILEGTVPTEAVRRRAGELAWDVPGAHDVLNALAVAT